MLRLVGDSVCVSAVDDVEVRGDVHRPGNCIERESSESRDGGVLRLPSGGMLVKARDVNDVGADSFELGNGCGVVGLLREGLMVSFAVGGRARDANDNDKVDDAVEPVAGEP